MNENRLVTNEELILSNMLEIQALIRILSQKGITSEDEILKEVLRLREEMEKKIAESKKTN